jgi:hypothetical protein
MLFRRTDAGWEQVYKGTERTREPSPLTCLEDRVLLSVNPTLTPPDTYSGPSQPQILEFSSTDPQHGYKTILPGWQGQPPFSEHSYRSFVADSSRGEMILFQDIGYTHAEWAFCESGGAWSAQGQLVWPWGGEYDEPQPIRVCYPAVQLKNRALYFCGVSDIVEPYKAWREYKLEITGRKWDFDFRRLFFTWSDDITTGQFHQWIEVSSRDKTCGWISPCDMWVEDHGKVHILWTERAIDERLRGRFFPLEKQTVALNYAALRDGVVWVRRALHVGGEGESSEVPGWARFQSTPDGRLFVFYHMGGKDADGNDLSQNRLLEIMPDGAMTASVSIPLHPPITSFFTATERGGSQPSQILDVFGDVENVMRYARIKIT